MIVLYAVISLVIVIIFETSSELPEWFNGGHKMFSIINMIASSFLASSIFYFIQAYLPSKKIKKMSLMIIKPILKKLLDELELLMYWFNELVIIDNSGETQLYSGNYFPNATNIERHFDVSKDLELNAIEVNKLIMSLYKTKVLQNLELDFPLNTLMRYFEEGSSYRNTLKVSGALGKENIFFCNLKNQISEINEAYISLENYYNKMFK